jgi:hypothetical protein
VRTRGMDNFLHDSINYTVLSLVTLDEPNLQDIP